MKFDRFDIVEAYYMYFVHFHKGMRSGEYERLSKMRSYFTPAMDLSIDSLTENGLEIYNKLVDRAYATLYETREKL